MKNKVKVRKYRIKYHGKKYEILIPKFTPNSLWVRVTESEDGNAVLRTYKRSHRFFKKYDIDVLWPGDQG